MRVGPLLALSPAHGIEEPLAFAIGLRKTARKGQKEDFWRALSAHRRGNVKRDLDALGFRFGPPELKFPAVNARPVGVSLRCLTIKLATRTYMKFDGLWLVDRQYYHVFGDTAFLIPTGTIEPQAHL